MQVAIKMIPALFCNRAEDLRQFCNSFIDLISFDSDTGCSVHALSMGYRCFYLSAEVHQQFQFLFAPDGVFNVFIVFLRIFGCSFLMK